MGGRLSVPKAADHLSEAPSKPRRLFQTATLNARHLTAPLAALTMATLLFVYTRSSIRAAKHNAQRHREAGAGGGNADGGSGGGYGQGQGQVSWYNESQRHHGLRPPVPERSLVQQVREDVMGGGKGGGGEEEVRDGGRKEDGGGGEGGGAMSESERRLRGLLGK